MATPKEVATVVIALTIAATLFVPIADTVEGNSGTQTVTNESVTADVGNYTELDGYRIDEDSETVYNASGAEMTRGTDYEMGYENGSIKALSGGSISDGTTIQVSYDYQATDGTTSTILDLVPLFVALLILGVMAAKIQEAM